MNHTESATSIVDTSTPTIKRFRRGDVREDGRIFWGNSKREGERWYTPDQFHRRKAAVSAYGKKQYASPEQGERIRQKNKEWQRVNVQRATRRANDRRKERRQADPLFALITRFRVNFHQSLKKRDMIKRSKCAEVLGCTWKEFTDHIESRFLPGMSWDNRSEWHIDHIVPLALAKTEQDVIDLNHYSNLRPLWATDNLIKSDSLPPRELVPEHLLRFIDPSS